MAVVRRWCAALLAWCGAAGAFGLPMSLDLAQLQPLQAAHAWPVSAPLPPPDGLRPCCAFGYDLNAEALGVPIPFYRLNNVVEADALGGHRYNDSLFGALASLAGLGSERNGLIYTRRGGFLDLAHVRDSADMTVYIFSHLYPRLGQAFRLDLGDELARRQLVFSAFTPPHEARERYTLAAYLAARLAFEVAAWHEVAQWYGYESIPGFSEGVSAFSPEDLYSNLLGTRLALTLILNGHTASLGQYSAALTTLLPQALCQLQAQPAILTRFQFDMLDGKWWDSRQAVPQKFLVLKRNYDTRDDRLPTSISGELTPPLRLMLPGQVHRYDLAKLAELRLLPGVSMKRLPVPPHYYTWRDFGHLAAFAQAQDTLQLSRKR
ncbi:DUF4056 domain-containing protein [Edwardsiella anguillarum]|uniref:DUF4056 domain-containing protein n=1 Tax=Edwardsiella anguillarum TaxID=1821960 RepID=UPI0024B789A9|nr:DUF4056 domain-containing protein [Edwardsiella anguillarum]WHP81981.1 DUF4056 domain-containing protein [Edwardsiella anguillarum]WHQ19513.1 DUF4056 domain-containing protein [Edwardsiella anguillarum]WHQ23059.1 DUF4056 domain-containing protein [Edwardsiella anguillarum]WHQ26583.1 DUF4056 domain-containing protein [Edwardsiella anguillarum]WHQ30099.1 DUF4056 domain-containing protein [Edwardsiella anguillarum]